MKLTELIKERTKIPNIQGLAIEFTSVSSDPNFSKRLWSSSVSYYSNGIKISLDGRLCLRVCPNSPFKDDYYLIPLQEFVKLNFIEKFTIQDLKDLEDKNVIVSVSCNNKKEGNKLIRKLGPFDNNANFPILEKFHIWSDKKSGVKYSWNNGSDNYKNHIKISYRDVILTPLNLDNKNIEFSYDDLKDAFNSSREVKLTEIPQNGISSKTELKVSQLYEDFSEFYENKLFSKVKECVCEIHFLKEENTYEIKKLLHE